MSNVYNSYNTTKIPKRYLPTTEEGNAIARDVCLSVC